MQELDARGNLHDALPEELMELTGTTRAPRKREGWAPWERCAQLCPELVQGAETHRCRCIVIREHHRRNDPCSLCNRQLFGKTQQRMYTQLTELLQSHPKRWWLVAQVPVPKLEGQGPSELRWGHRQSGKQTKRSPFYVDVLLLLEHEHEQYFPIVVEFDGRSHQFKDWEAQQRHDERKAARRLAVMHCFQIDSFQLIEWKHTDGDLVDTLDHVVNMLVTL